MGRVAAKLCCWNRFVIIRRPSDRINPSVCREKTQYPGIVTAQGPNAYSIRSRNSRPTETSPPKCKIGGFFRRPAFSRQRRLGAGGQDLGPAAAEEVDRRFRRRDRPPAEAVFSGPVNHDAACFPVFDGLTSGIVPKYPHGGIPGKPFGPFRVAARQKR